MESAKLVEAPYRAAHLVLAARKEDRAAVARAAVEAVLAKHPTAVASTVRAVLTVAPEQVQAVLEAVMAQTPKAFKTALAVIGEMDQSALGLAVKTVGSLSPGDLATAQTFAAQFEPTKGGEVGLAKAGGKNLGPSQQSSVVAQKKVAENRLNP